MKDGTRRPRNNKMKRRQQSRAGKVGEVGTRKLLARGRGCKDAEFPDLKDAGEVVVEIIWQP